MWFLTSCLVCDGSGSIFCRLCEADCEHDRDCPSCSAFGKAPEKIEGYKAIMAQGAGLQSFKTKKAAEAAISEDVLYKL